MDQLIAALPYLACPVGMGFMMWMMSRRQRDGGRAGAGTATAPPAASSPTASPTVPPAGDAQLAELRAELARVRAHQEAIAREIDSLGTEDAAAVTREDGAAAGRGAAR